MDEILENIVIENGLTKYTGGDVIVKLCIAIYDNGGSNDQLVKKVPESFKYLSTGDEITSEGRADDPYTLPALCSGVVGHSTNWRNQGWHSWEFAIHAKY